MLTQEEDVEIHAMAKRGWTISEIARHTGRDRKTIRGYLDCVRQPGVRAALEPDPFDRIEPYVAVPASRLLPRSWPRCSNSVAEK